MSDALLRFTGPLAALSARDCAELFDRTTSSDEGVRARTAAIIARVRSHGDAALRELARELDGATLDFLEVPRDARCHALEQLDPALRQAMERSAANIARAHAAMVPRPVEVSTEPGITVGRRPDSLRRVGVYAPGGSASYPSSVLMGAIPARIAGVPEVVLCSPPDRTGRPAPVVLAAAELAQVDRVFALGGAGAIAALAYGTDSVPRVDRIVGPGNAYVAEAKLQVSGAVAIDSPAGPSELLVIADSTADAGAVAREMVAQAEHDPRACVVAVAIGVELATRIIDVLRTVQVSQPRATIIAQALARRGGVLAAGTLDEAVRFANNYAAEHLLLAVADPRAALAELRNTGTVFLGTTSSVAFGDYMSGANHVLPTGGLARAYSGLSTLDFVRWTTYQQIDATAAAGLAADVETFAAAEGLPAHAAAARWAGGRRGPRIEEQQRTTNEPRIDADERGWNGNGDEPRIDAEERGSIVEARELQVAESGMFGGPGTDAVLAGQACRGERDGAPTTTGEALRVLSANSPAPAPEARPPHPPTSPGPGARSSTRARSDPRSSASSASSAAAVVVRRSPRPSAPIRGSAAVNPRPSTALRARASYREISLYAPDRSAARIDLSDNTNLWGVPPAAERVIRELSTSGVTRYPAPYAADLKAALADYAGVRPEEIVTGCGSDDVLDSAIRAFAEPGDRIAYPDPSFAMLPLFAKMNGLQGVPVPLTSDFDFDAEAFLATDARVIYLCSPNNPTGAAAARRSIEHIIAHAPGLVILDEAYAEFADDGFIAQAPYAERVLVVRTMSKACGLAGLRVGYAAGSSALVADVEKSRGPYKVNAIAERAAACVLREDVSWVESRVALVREHRARFTAALVALGLAPLASNANFVLVPVRDAAELAGRMRASGVAVRPFVALPVIGDALRITIGPWSMMEAALDALAGALACA